MTAYEPTELSAEAKRANARLRAALGRADRDFALARLLIREAQTPLPDVGPGVTLDVLHRSGHPTGTDWWTATRVGSTVRVLLADTAGPATPAGAMFPLYARAVAARYDELPPGELLAAVNRDLIALALDDPPVVAMAALNIEAESGRFVIARAGTPKPRLLSQESSPIELSVPGPLLGIFDAAEYPEHAGELRPAERIVLSTDGSSETSDDSTRLEILVSDASVQRR